MRFYYLILVFFFSIRASAQVGTEMPFQAEAPLQDLQILLKKYGGAAGSPGQGGTQHPHFQHSVPNTNILLDHYQQSGGIDSTQVLSKGQTTLFGSSKLTFLGAGFTAGARLFMDGGKIDYGRSGLSFSFERQTMLQQMQDQQLAQLPSTKQAYLSRLKTQNLSLAQAMESLVLDDYLAVINSAAYQNAHQQVMLRTDSLINRPSSKFSEHEQALMADRQKIEAFVARYRVLVATVSKQPGAIRQRARAIVDSCLNEVDYLDDEHLRQAVLQSKKTPLFQKLLLLSQGFSVGNTRLAADGFISAGLPIRGISYSYDHGGIKLGIQHGRRILSDRFLPNQGTVFHDRLGEMRLTQATVEIIPKVGDSYQFSALVAAELPGDNQIVGSGLLRTNRVLGVHGNTAYAKNASIITDFHYATTILQGKLPVPNDMQSNGYLSRASARIGTEIDLNNGSLQAGAFYRGKDFLSFGNPYLITDFQGAFAQVNLGLFNQRLQGDFTMEFGNGTQPATRENARIQLRGSLRASVTPKLTASVMVAPNVFRYEVSNQQGLSENSIYRAQLAYRTISKDRPLTALVSLTNLDQGWTWNDSTTVTKSALLRTTLTLPISKKVSFTADAQRSVARNTPAEWFHAFSGTYEKQFRLQAGLRYDKFRHEARGAMAATLDLFLPLGKNVTLNANLYFRPQSGSPEDMNPMLFQLHQALEGRF